MRTTARADYNADFYDWCMEQARFLANGEFDNLDLENLKEEIESMGKRDFRELKNRFAVLICHLLKWQFQSELQGKSWKLTITVQRREIQDLLKDSPSLRPKIKENFSDFWAYGVEKAQQETGLPDFPSSPIWTIDDILADDFYPEQDAM